MSVSYVQDDLDSFIDESDARTVKILRRRFTGGLLYADRLVDLDPLSFWVYQHQHTYFGRDRLGVRWALIDAWNALTRVEPLLDAECLVLAPIPAPHEADELAQSAGAEAADIDLFWDALLVAARSEATLADWPWRRAQSQIARALTEDQVAAIHLRVAEALAVVELPLLTEIPVDTLVDIRESEEAFNAWRAELRRTTRLLQSAADDDHFAREAQHVFEDVLLPKAQAVRRSVSRSAALQAAVREQPVRTTLGALAAGGAAAATAGSLEAAAQSTVFGGIGQVVAAALLRPRLRGSAAVLPKIV